MSRLESLRQTSLGIRRASRFFAIALVLATPILEAKGRNTIASPDGILNTSQTLTSLRNTVWWSAAQERRLDPYILYAVALVESAQLRQRAVVAPWPWALNREGQAIIPGTQAEAGDILRASIDQGIRSIDVGLMQVNLRWNGHRVARPEQLLNPATNIRIGADILAEAMASAPNDEALGIGRYHAGFRNEANAYRYGRLVLAVAGRLREIFNS